MMTHVGRFAWHGMMTTDFAASEAFYCELFDWTLDESDQASGYRRLRSGGQAFGGMMTWPPDGPSQSMWTGYVVTEDLANTAKHLAFIHCAELNLCGMVDAETGVLEAELLSGNAFAA